jgi:hypothetical protein
MNNQRGFNMNSQGPLNRGGVSNLNIDHFQNMNIFKNNKNTKKGF